MSRLVKSPSGSVLRHDILLFIIAIQGEFPCGRTRKADLSKCTIDYSIDVSIEVNITKHFFRNGYDQKLPGELKSSTNSNLGEYWDQTRQKMHLVEGFGCFPYLAFVKNTRSH